MTVRNKITRRINARVNRITRQGGQFFEIRDGRTDEEVNMDIVSEVLEMSAWESRDNMVGQFSLEAARGQL